MSQELPRDDRLDRHSDEKPDPAPAGNGTPPSPVAADLTDPFYERLSLGPALGAIVARTTSQIKPR